MKPAYEPPGLNRTVGFLRYFVEHHTAANLFLILMLAIGLVSVKQIRAQFFPDIVIETIKINVTWSGAGPMEVDNAIVARLEPLFRAVDGVDDVRSLASEGKASITMDFLPDWDMASALEDVKTVVDGFNDLPEDADEPRVRRRRYSDRVTNVVILGHVPITHLDRYIDELRTRLFKAGVTNTIIQGIAKPRIVVEPKSEALERYQISLQDVAEAVSGETGTMAVGETALGAARVRAGSNRVTAAALASVAVRALPDGSKLTLGNIAEVREEKLDRNVSLFRQGVPAALLQVRRDSKGDALKIFEIVQDQVAAMEPTLPDGVEITLAQSRAKAISGRLNILIRNGATGLAIVVVLLFLFLSARTAFWVAAGIPVAMAATIALLYISGASLNMVSLFALIICLGIVVDDAIVVGEHADHLARRGMKPVDAASIAATRMAAPVFSASITTVIAFSGLTFVGGRFGRVISDIPFTVSAVIIASLLECFLILPAHMRHALEARAKESVLDLPSRLVNKAFVWVRETLFRPFISATLRLRYPVVALGVLILAITVSAVLERTVRWRFFSAPERSVIVANIAMLPGAKREDTKSMLDEMERALRVVDKKFAAEHGAAPVIVALAKLGGTTGRGLSGAATKDPDLLGSFNIELIDPDLRTYSAFDFIGAWKGEVDKHPFLETIALRGEHAGPGADDVEISLTGADNAVLKAAAETVKIELGALPDVSGLEDDLSYDKPELVVTLKPKGEALNLSTAIIARQLRQRLDGNVATSFARDGKEVEVEVRLPENEIGASYLYDAMLRTPGGGFVPLTDVATIHEVQGFATVRRVDGERIVTVNGAVAEDAAVQDAVYGALHDRILPAVAAQYGVDWSIGGLAQQAEEFLTDATLGFGLCLIGIFLVLAWVFGSWVRPVTIMLVIPFGAIGAVWGHYLHGVPLTMFSVVGLIGMAGIIINDSIVLVTTIDGHAKNRDIRSAIIDGAADRLRAVLLTSMTTVGGLAPLLFEQSRQALFLKPTVITLAYGLGFGVVLVLLLTPAMLAIQEDIQIRLRSARRFGKYLVSGRGWRKAS